MEGKKMSNCQWHDILPEEDCPFCNPVLTEVIYPDSETE
jgi:hypothetical protein